jgi:hypothetical protein
MATALQFGKQAGKLVDPDLKEFIDLVIVPILVKEYLTLNASENDLANRDRSAGHSDDSTAAPTLSEVRP